MANKTKIEWTDFNWNFIRGCSRVSEGCRHCYAETVAHRFGGPGQPYEGLTVIGGDGAPRWNGKITFHEDILLKPLHWKKPRKIFVNSMSDLFHENVSFDIMRRAFQVMAECQQHTFQILTKRPQRMRDFIIWHIMQDVLGNDFYKLYKNVWLGVSCEDQKTADERIPILLETPAAMRWISAEPLLGPISLKHLQRDGEVEIDCLAGRHGVTRPLQGKNEKLDWVVVGGESGPGARPMHPDWLYSLRDQCVAAGVPYFFKQWGNWSADSTHKDQPDAMILTDGRAIKAKESIDYVDSIGSIAMANVGKKAAGRLLDGVEWNQYPEGKA